MNSDLTQTQLLRQVRLALQNQDFAQAIASLEQAAQLAREQGDFASEGRHLGNLALLYYRLGQADTALGFFEQALANARAENDRSTENGLLGNIGNILRELGRYAEATDYLNQALLIAQEIGDVRGRGIWLGNLGLVYDDLGQPADAIPLHEQSVAIARQLYDRRGLAARLGNLGNSYVTLGDYRSALLHFSQCASICRELGDTQALALRLGIMGNLYAELGRQAESVGEQRAYFDLALDYYRQTLALAQRLGDAASQAQLWRSMGNLYIGLNDFDEALQCLDAAYHQFEALGQHDQLAPLQHSIELAQAARTQSRKKTI